MAGIHKIADTSPTIDNFCVRIRVIRLWTLPSYGNSPSPYSIEMVCLDEDVDFLLIFFYFILNGEKIHASIKRAFVSRFMNLLEKGISYQIRYFGVGLNKSYFKTTHHEYVVNLNQRTDVYILPESSSIPRYRFKFVSFDTLNALGYDCTYLKKYNLFILLIISAVFFFNKLIDNNFFYFKSFRMLLDILLKLGEKRITNLPKKILLQNFMYGTKMFFNLEDTNVIQFKNSFVRFKEPRDNVSKIPNKAAFLKIYQGKTIEQLKELDTNVICVVLTTISHIMDTPNWWYGQCETTGPHILLQKFSNVQVVAFGVIDDFDCACFVVFDKEAKQILEKSCVYILDPLLLDVDYTGDLFPISKACSIIEGEKVEGAMNLLLEFSNEVATNDESELLENAITLTKRLSSESEDSKVEGDTSTCKKMKIENET
ncbi:hypothetical protein Ahy_A09g043618 [Arachis hypogaea]|uniref:Replication protein A 70 kDa DNA-binding subunit B/D first OB fold domain-containing protein n=1 Tax=Arachis hypogaea TaxID=3818 RepID=A0A445BIQ2_ARAHY|nr:hypothetical protein Ahy_A09g043618 [Arachis hypogaea]